MIDCTDRWIRSPQDPLLDEFCARLESVADGIDAGAKWPTEQLAWCAEFGVWSWFLPPEFGGQGWSDADILAAYLQMGRACLTTTFITTQWSAAARRIAASGHLELARKLAPSLLRGDSFCTVGISHLTTSRQHVARPVLRAREDRDHFILDGFSPWVTGGAYADILVTGATLDDGRQILAAVPARLSGVEASTPLRLVGLSASATGQVNFTHVRLAREHLLAGPVENVLSQISATQAGGLQTSTLALASASASLDILQEEAQTRGDLRQPADELRAERDHLERDLFALAAGETSCTAEEARIRANSLVLRASQAALAAAKGSGYAWQHRAGRLCREALFFLVWSCPQPVVQANLCELAGLAG